MSDWRPVDELPAPPVRPHDAHKGTFGRVLVIAGSRRMSGAAALSGLGALRGGAGLVYVAVPEGIVPIVAGIEPSYLTIPLLEDADGRIAWRAKFRLATSIESASAVALGPGLGRSRGLVELVRELYATIEKPLVVDADGLNALARVPEVFASAPAPRVLTPHPGEFARLSGLSIGDIQRQRETTACQFARTHGVVLVLKGAGTVVTDGDRLAVNATGNSGMATGGTGDVLTGLLAALLAQGMPVFEAARLGVHLHGLAGDLAASELSRPGLIASDVARFLSAAWREFAADGEETSG